MMISLPATNCHHLATSGITGSFPDDGCDGVPEMITTSSLQSTPEGDDDSISLSSSSRSFDRASQSPLSSSPRSIFGKYWSSPTYKSGVSETLYDDDSDDEVMARMQKLQLPFAIDYGTSEDAGVDEVVPLQPKKKCLDDDSVDYGSALAAAARGPAGASRRRILPTPPPPTAVSSSLLRPKLQPQLFLRPVVPGKSFSTSALLAKKGRPRRSCLRETRYSCSAIVAAARLHSGLRNEGSPNLRDEFKKSVSFQSKVSVFEFPVPRDQQRSQAGWSKHFA